jgi:hypothetical protein
MHRGRLRQVGRARDRDRPPAAREDLAAGQMHRPHTLLLGDDRGEPALGAGVPVYLSGAERAPRSAASLSVLLAAGASACGRCGRLLACLLRSR